MLSRAERFLPSQAGLTAKRHSKNSQGLGRGGDKGDEGERNGRQRSCRKGLLPSLGGPGRLFGSHMLEPQWKKRRRGSQVKKGERSSGAEGTAAGSMALSFFNVIDFLKAFVCASPN